MKVDSPAVAPPLLLLASLAMLGAFATDAYLPAFARIGRDLQASPAQVQQTLTVFLIGFAFMNLWHGALSDALGRRKVVLVALALFAAASVACALATSIEVLLVARFAQGLVAGAGMVIGRAVVRDVCSGAAAQRQIARISMLFAAAPIVAPLVGGWLVTLQGWAAVFVGLALLGALVFVYAWFTLVETLPAERRVALHPVALARAYSTVFRDRRVQRLAPVALLAQSGVLLYVAGAPIVLLEHYALKETEFHWQFGPMVAGVFLGAAASSRMASRLPPSRQAGIGFLLMALSASADVGLAAAGIKLIPLNFVPIFVHALGMMMVMTLCTTRMLDRLPQVAGTVSSGQSFVQGLGFAVIAGLVVPLVAHSLLALALTKAAFVTLGFVLWYIDSIEDSHVIAKN